MSFAITDFLSGNPKITPIKQMALPAGYRDLELSWYMSRLQLFAGQISSETAQMRMEREEFEKRQKELLRSMLGTEHKFGLVLEAHANHFTFHLKFKPKMGAEESFFFDCFKYRKMKAEKLYSQMQTQLESFGFTEAVLAERLMTFEYENDEVFDEMALLLKQRISRSLVVLPYLSHLVGTAIVKLLRTGHAENLQVSRLRTVLRSSKDKRVLKFKECVDQMMSEKFDDQEEWMEYAFEAAENLLKNFDAVPGDLFRLRTTALLMADWTDLLEPMKMMKEKLMSTPDTARHYSGWMGASFGLQNVRLGQGRHRVAVLKGEMAKTSTQKETVKTECSVRLEPVVDEICELCNHRFNMHPDSNLDQLSRMAALKFHDQ